MKTTCMKKLIAFLPFLIQTATAQVQWADEVVSVSSAFKEANNSYSYSALQALGSPSVLPSLNVSSQTAWSPAAESGIEFLEVKFSTPIKAAQVIINESFNPGCITSIELFGVDKKLLKSFVDSTGFKKGDLNLPLTFVFEKTLDLVKSVRISLNTGLVTGYNHIDAIGLSASSIPYKIEVNHIDYKGVVPQKERLPYPLNSMHTELLPVISPDGKSLYMVREAYPDCPETTLQHVWKSEISNNSTFSNPIYFSEPINNKDNNAVCSVTPDGQKLLLMNAYKPDGTMTKGVSISEKSGDGWSFPKVQVIEDYRNDNNYGEYALTNDGKTMLMTTQRLEGFGNKDIQVSFLKEDGSWTKPKNLGPTINTAASETSPFLASDGKTLYFSSRGHLGYGNSDVFMSTKLSDSWDDWSDPVNLGPAINSKLFDAYYTIPARGDYAYFVNYTDTSKGDIFRVKLPESARPKPVVLVKGSVLDGETKMPIGSSIAYESLSLNKELGIALANSKDGFYSIVLPSGDFYGFHAEASNYYPVSQNIDLTKISEFKEITVDLLLFPIKVGQTVKLNNVFFDTGKFSFRKETFGELNRLVAFMNDNSTISISIQGHTDNVGDDAANKLLSTNRAKAVYDYLIKSNIDASRIKYEGFGELKPVDVNTTESGKQNNRRVEFVILKL
jgi:OmpA-OmpF porin, OOP family